MPSKCKIHRYHQKKFTHSKKVWACANPHCNHYMPPHLEDHVEGKESLCNQCGKEFILTSDSMKESNPRCDDCRLGFVKSAEDNTGVVLTDVMREFLEGKR